MIDYSDSSLSHRLLNHHYTILSQRFFLLENCKKSIWKRERQRFLDKVPAEVFDTRTCVEQQQRSARKGFHPVAPQSSCLPSFSQVTFCKFHRFLGPKTPNWISCFKYPFLPLFITSETFCSAEWLQLWGEIVTATVWQKIEVQLYQCKTQKNRWECLDLQRNCHPSKKQSYFYLVLASSVFGPIYFNISSFCFQLSIAKESLKSESLCRKTSEFKNCPWLVLRR